MHLREVCQAHDLEPLRALAEARDLQALNLLLHEMMRRPDAQPCPGCEGRWQEHEVEWDDGSITTRDECERCARQPVRGYVAAPPFDYLRADVPLDRFMELLPAAQAWTGNGWLLLFTEIHHDRCALAYLIDSGIDPHPALVKFAVEQRTQERSPAQAIVLACLAACIVYGEEKKS